MSDDIIQRLDELVGNEFQWCDVWEVAYDAAFEIKNLRNEIAAYKRNGIVDVTGSINYESGYNDGLRAARAAMGESDG